MEPLTLIEILLIVSWIVLGMFSMLYVWLKEETFSTLGELVVMLLIGAVAGWLVALMLLIHALDTVKLPKTKWGDKINKLWNYKIKKNG